MDLIAHPSHQLQTAEGVTVDWAEGVGLPANPACILGHGVMRSNEKKSVFQATKFWGWFALQQ